MKRRFFLSTLPFALFLGVACKLPDLPASQAQTTGRSTFVAMVAKSGAVTIRRVENDQVVATVLPGLFEQTWQLRNLGGGQEIQEGPNGTAIAQGTINASQSGATVAVRTSVGVSGNTLTVTSDLTPDKPVPVNSTQISVNVGVSDWLDGTASLGTVEQLSRPIPQTAKETNLISGNGRQLQLKRESNTFAVGSEQDLMLQDNRVFGNNTLEVRVGKQGERTLESGKAETISVTITLPGTVTLEREAPLILRAGADWIPLDLKLDIAPKSALDFSFLNDAPAGKYGRVIVRLDKHFGFANRKEPVRFWGVNLCFTANYLTHEESDRLAERLARIGYNTVRIHHYEGDLIDQNAPNSLTFRADQLDKLDYLIAALKKWGIYIKTDLYVSRPVRADEMGVSTGLEDFKAALLVSPKAMENWKAFTKNLLTHVNPYTRLAYKDDPAIAFLSVVNEPNATTYIGRLSGTLGDLFQAEWQTFLKNRYITEDRLRTAWGDTGATFTSPLPKSFENNQRGSDAGAFFTTLHMKAFRTMREWIRVDLDCQTLLTDLNGWAETPAFMAARTQLDWVDNHFYWDHPRFLERDWSLPSAGSVDGRSALTEGGAGPNSFAMTRLLDRPFSYSEFNYSNPNRYRVEGGLLMGAASALQDWDAIWRFAYSHAHDSVIAPAPLNYFDMASDPAGQASERAALLLFLRRDLTPAPASLALLRTREDLLDTKGAPPTDSFSDLTLVAKVGTYVAGPQKQVPVAPAREVRLTSGDSAKGLEALKRDKRFPAANRTNLSKGIRESITGEVLVEGQKGVLRIATPRTMGGIIPAGETLTAGSLTITSAGTRNAVWISSLDKESVEKSKRLLITHITDIQNSDMRYAGPDRVVLNDWGKLPHLVRRGAATLVLKRSGGGTVEAWRLDTAGNRVAPLPVEAKDGVVTLRLSTAAPDGKATLYYEVVVR